MPRRTTLSTAFPIAVALAFALGLLVAGCGGGGGGSAATGPVVDTSAVVGTIAGYVYIPLSSVSAPGRAPDPVLPALPAAPAALVLPAAPAAPLKAAPQGYIPFANAVVQLAGTTKATITTTAGYFEFKVTQADNLSGYVTVSVTKPDANISITFLTQFAAGANKVVQIEIANPTVIKELSSGPAGAGFVYLTGRVSTSSGFVVPAATLTAVLTTDTTQRKTAISDANGFYAFTGLAEGTWQITAAKAGYRPSNKTVTLSPDYTLTNIELTLSGTFDITDVLATKVMSTTATLEWQTSVPAVCRVDYGNTVTYGATTPQEGSYVNTHSVSLTGLFKSTTYHYRITAKDSNDNQVVSEDKTFITAEDDTPLDVTAPEITNFNVTKTHNSFKVIFTLSKMAFGKLEYGTSRNAMVATNRLGPSTTITINVTDLLPATTYYIDLLGINVNEPTAIARVALDPVTTAASPDVTAPAITNVRVKSVSPTAATLAWETTDELSDSQVYYDVVAGAANKAITSYSRSSALADSSPLVAAHEVTITGLEIEKTYYARAVSRDPSGNAGVAAAELSFTTTKPNTTIAFAATGENPAAGFIAVGEAFENFKLKVIGQKTEPVSLTKLIFKQSGTALSSEFEAVDLIHGLVTVPGTLSGGLVTFDLKSSTIEIATESEEYFNLRVKMKEAAFGKTVLLGLEAKDKVTATGVTYGRAVEASNVFPLNANAFTVSKGQLTLAAAGSATIETTLSTSGNDTTLLEFSLAALYEDVYVSQVQIEQIGDAGSNDSAYVNVRLYSGTAPLATVAPGIVMPFIGSGLGLITIPKGQTKNLSIVATVPSSARPGKTIQFRVKVDGVTGSGKNSALPAVVVGATVVGSKYTLGDSAIAAKSANSSPTSQTFVTGDTQKTFFAFTLEAGGAEDINVTSITLAQAGSAASGDLTDFHLVANNQTKGTTAFIAPSTTFSNPTGLIYVPAGTQVVVTVIGNVNATAGRTIQLGIKSAGDVVGTGASSHAIKASTGIVAGATHVVVGKLQTTVAATLPATPSGTLVLNSTAQPLFKFSAKSVGEAVTYRTVYVRLIGDTRIVSNMTLSDGTTTYTTPEVTQYGYAFNLAGGTTAANNTPATFTLAGDVTDNSALVGQTVKFYVDNGACVVSGDASLNVFTSINPIYGNTLSLTLGSLAIGSTAAVVPPAYVVAGTTGAEIVGAFTLTAGAAEGVNVSSIAVNELKGALLYGPTADLVDLKLYDGATYLGTATNTGVSYVFSLSPALAIVAAGVKTYTLKATIPATAQSGRIAQFGVRGAAYVTAKGALSNLALTPTGTAQSNPFLIRRGALAVVASSANPPATDYPKNTAVEVEFLRFKLSADALEDMTLTKAYFKKGGTESFIDNATFALRQYDANGVYAGKTWNGTDVAIDGSNVTFDLAAPALTLDAQPLGTTDVEFRLFAKFATAQLLPGQSVNVDMLSPVGVQSVGAISQQTIDATNTVTGNSMRILDVADTTPPAISQVAAPTVTQTYARITWTTDTDASSKVQYKKTADVAWSESAEYDSSTRVTAHEVGLYGLAYSTPYDFKVVSTDAAGNSATSVATGTFTTMTPLFGKLTISADAPDPLGADAPANTALTFLQFKLAAANDATNAENVNVNSIKFTKAGTAVAADFGLFTLTSGTLSWTGTLSGTTVTFNTTSPQLMISKDSAAATSLTLAGVTTATAVTKTATLSIAAAGDVNATGAVYLKDLASPLTLTGTATGTTRTFRAGSLVLTQAGTTSVGNPVLPGRSDLELASFTLAADNREAVQLKKLALTQLLDATLTGDLTNLRLMDGATTVASAAVAGNVATFGGGAAVLATLDPAVTKTYRVLGSLQDSATAGRRFQFQLLFGGVESAGASTAIALSTTGGPVTGSSFIIGSASLEVALNEASPVSTVFKPGSATAVTFAKFDLKTGSAEDLSTTKVTLSFAGTAVDTTDLTNLKLNDGAINHTLVYAAGPPKVFTTADAIVLPHNSTSTWTVIGDVVGTNGGRNFLLEIQPGGVEVTGGTTGTAYTSIGTATGAKHYLVGDVVLAAGARMPAQASDLYIAGNPVAVPLFAFTVKANNEDATIGQLKLALTGASGNLSGVTLLDVTNNLSYTGVTFAGGKYQIDTATPQAMTITAGATRQFVLYGKIPQAATIGATLKLSLSAADLSATGVTSNQALSTTGDVAGNSLAILRGALVAATRIDTPATAEILIGGAYNAEAWFTLAGSSVETILVQSLAVREYGSTVDGTDIAGVNLYLRGDTTALPSSRTLANHVYTFGTTGTELFRILTGETVLVQVKAQVPTTATPRMAVQFFLDAGAAKARGAVSATGLLPATATNIVSTGTGSGASQVLAVGGMSVVADANPSFQAAYNNYVEIGSTGVQLFRFSLAGTAGGATSLEDVNVTAIKIKLIGTVASFGKFTLSDASGAFVKSITPSTNDLLFTGFSDGLAAGSSEIYTLTGDIAPTAGENSPFNLAIDEAGFVTGTGATTGQAIAATGTATYYSFVLKKRSLTVAAPDAGQIQGLSSVAPGSKFEAFRFKLTAGSYEPLTNLQIKVTKSAGTIADANLQAALYDGTTKIADYATFSGGCLTFAPGSTHVLGAGQTKTYTVYAYPQLTAGNLQTFALSIAAIGDASAAGTLSPAATVASTGTVTNGGTHMIKRSGMIVSLASSQPTGANVLHDQIFEAFRFSLSTDGVNPEDMVISYLALTNAGAAIDVATDWEIQGLYDSNGNLLLDEDGLTVQPEWNCQSPATWMIPVPYTVAPGGIPTTVTYIVKAKCKSNAIAGHALQLQLAAADITAKESGTGTAVTVEGSATGSVFTVKKASLTFSHLDAEVLRGHAGAAPGYRDFLVGNTPLAANKKYVAGVFKITNDKQENVKITNLIFTQDASAIYGTDFSNVRLYVIGGTGKTDTSGAVTEGATSFDMNKSLTVSGNGSIFNFVLDSVAGGATDPLAINTNSSTYVAILVDFPTAGREGREIKFSLAKTGVTAYGDSSNPSGTTNTVFITSTTDATGVTCLLNKRLTITASPNDPSSFRAQVPFGGDDDYNYTVYKFRIVNNDSQTATIQSGSIHSSCSSLLPLSKLDGSGAGPRSKIQVLASGGGTLTTQFRTSVDLVNNKLNWTLAPTFNINSGDYVEVVYSIYMGSTAVEAQSILFDVQESSWSGVETGAPAETLVSYGTNQQKNAHLTGDTLLVGASLYNYTWAGTTLEAYYGPGAPTTSVLHFKVTNLGPTTSLIDSITVTTAGSATFGSAADIQTNAMLGLKYPLATTPFKFTNPAAVTHSGLTPGWTFVSANYAGGAYSHSLISGDSVEVLLLVKKQEFSWGAGVKPANWPLTWPYQAAWPTGPVGDGTGTWPGPPPAVPFWETWPAEGFGTGFNFTSPVESHDFSAKAADNAVHAANAGNTQHFRSSGTVSGKTYNLGVTAEVHL